jgi:uracil-DNA glycosylase
MGGTMMSTIVSVEADLSGGARRPGLPPSWSDALEPVLGTADVQRLLAWLDSEEEAGKRIYPPRENRLRAFTLTPLEAVKVVILGQDPYHGAGQAHGLAFSVPDGVKVPPSLRNIRKEIASDCGGAAPAGGNLEPWARQGVLLLNTSLSVEEGRAGSHAKLGWEAVTDAAVAAVAAKAEPCVFMLWGAHAQRKAERVPDLSGQGRHLVLTAAHPSPLSARNGFFGSRHFSQANAFLEAHGRAAVDWNA